MRQSVVPKSAKRISGCIVPRTKGIDRVLDLGSNRSRIVLI